MSATCESVLRSNKNVHDEMYYRQDYRSHACLKMLEINRKQLFIMLVCNTKHANSPVD